MNRRNRRDAAVHLVETWNLCRVAHERLEHGGLFAHCALRTCREARSTLEHSLSDIAPIITTQQTTGKE